MENCEETNIMPFVDVEEFNCDVINHSSCIGDDSIFLAYAKEEITNGFCCIVNAVVVETSIKDSLFGTVVSFEKMHSNCIMVMHLGWGLVFTRHIQNSRQDIVYANHKTNTVTDRFAKIESTMSKLQV
ncbi:hypothetical protein M9H77_21959 [Catharanthus roseus]|uniref:Uncharacterized protein n=1 Tax=Catharanthus roseus TaxID=4058 RepID=A0ACC0APH3_CATRO|nr:hypothetical protein M9H77_21959 [Catharanthus roseus]